MWCGTARSNMAQPWHGTAPVSSIACVQVVAVLPPADHELPLGWVPLEDTPSVPGVTWKTLTIQPPCSGQGPDAQGELLGSLLHLGAAWVPGTLGSGRGAGCWVPRAVSAKWDPFPGTDTQAFEALLLNPSDGTPPHPLVVCPHGECGDSGDTLAVLVAAQVMPMLAPGGPHAVFDARWRPSMAALCQLGFAVLLGECWGARGHVALCPSETWHPRTCLLSELSWLPGLRPGQHQLPAFPCG